MSNAMGENDIGGLVGRNADIVSHCYSTGSVSGDYSVGGLVGDNEYGEILYSYSCGNVQGTREVGGLAGKLMYYRSRPLTPGVTCSVWDTETSMQIDSEGGAGLTTKQMMDPEFLALNGWGNDPNWIINPGHDYPRLYWQGTMGEPIPQMKRGWIEGRGIESDPFVIENLDQLSLLHDASAFWDKHFILGCDLDLSGIEWQQAVFPFFWGHLHGNGFRLFNLSVTGSHGVGFVGHLYGMGIVQDVQVIDANITGSNYYSAILVGNNFGTVIRGHCSGSVRGGNLVGGIAGQNYGLLRECYSDACVVGSDNVGGAIGDNNGDILFCCSTGSVSGDSSVGGFAGSNAIQIKYCYSTSSVDCNERGGGFVGSNDDFTGLGLMSCCYSTGPVHGNKYIKGFSGGGNDWVSKCFWDVETSGINQSNAGIGLPTRDMMDVQTYLSAGWDFIDESENGLHDIWQMPIEGGYPLLGLLNGYRPPELSGEGTTQRPYQISSPAELGAVIYNDSKASYELVNDIDLAGIHWSCPVITEIDGCLDGNGFVVSNLTSHGGGLVGTVASAGEIRDLGVAEASITGSGILAGYNFGRVIRCYTSGNVKGNNNAGGLVGRNDLITGDRSGNTFALVKMCYSTADVSGQNAVGGLVGQSGGWGYSRIVNCFSLGNVRGNDRVGGLIGAIGSYISSSEVANCYSAGIVEGSDNTGGLIGSIRANYTTVLGSFWDQEASGLGESAAGIGMTSAEMTDVNTYLEAEWDFAGESENGVQEIWQMPLEHGYPLLNLFHGHMQNH